MKLDTDVRQLLGKKKKEVYPTKRSMNLYFKLDRTTAPATAVLYLLFALAVLLGLAKVTVYDPWAAAAALEEQVAAMEAQTDAQLQELESYEQVRKEYLRAAPTQDEADLVDPLEVLSLIDGTVRPEAAISQVDITENQVLLTFSGVTLRDAAELVTRLEQSPLVTSTSVDTASTIQDSQELVEVHVYMTVAPEEEPNP